MLFAVATFIIVAFSIWMWEATAGQGTRWKRVLLRATVILVCAAVAYVVDAVSALGQQMVYNDHFGLASSSLIKTTIDELQGGNTDHVIRVLRSLDLQYRPTYENRANYDVLVTDAVDRMTGRVPIEEGDEWDAPETRPEDWEGQWGSDNRRWIVVQGGGPSIYNVISWSGESEGRPVLSQDGTTLSFSEEDGSEHLLTFVRPYIITYQFCNPETGWHSETETFYKLARRELRAELGELH
jgi:hypothetical protein